MKIVTEQDAHIHEKKISFFRRYFRKTYERHGLSDFVTIENPPNAPDDLARILASDDYHGRLFELENRWYFSRSHLQLMDASYDRCFRKNHEADLKKVEDLYHSDLEEFIITNRREVQVLREEPWIVFAGYSLFSISPSLEVESLLHGVSVIKADFRANSRSVYVLKGSSFLIKLPCAMVTERIYQRRKVYDLGRDIVRYSWMRDDWKIEPVKKGDLPPQ